MSVNKSLWDVWFLETSSLNQGAEAGLGHRENGPESVSQSTGTEVHSIHWSVSKLALDHTHPGVSEEVKDPWRQRVKYLGKTQECSPLNGYMKSHLFLTGQFRPSLSH